MNPKHDDFKYRSDDPSIIDSWKCVALKFMPTILAMAILGIPIYLCTRHFRGNFLRVVISIMVVYGYLVRIAEFMVSKREERLSRR